MRLRFLIPALLVGLPLTAAAAIAAPYGIVRTVQPETSPITAGALTVEIDNWTNPPPTTGTWVYETHYRDLDRVRGHLTSTDPAIDPRSYRITTRVPGQSAVMAAPCYEPTPDAFCIFIVQLPNGTANGLEVTVHDKSGKQILSHVFRFEERTRYSSALWEGWMGI